MTGNCRTLGSTEGRREERREEKEKGKERRGEGRGVEGKGGKEENVEKVGHG